MVCVDENLCWAGGNLNSNLLKWDGSSWTQVATPDNGNISSIACENANSCWAGGNMDAKLLKWDGVSWTQISTPDNNNIQAIEFRSP